MSVAWNIGSLRAHFILTWNGLYGSKGKADHVNYGRPVVAKKKKMIESQKSHWLNNNEEAELYALENLHQSEFAVFIHDSTIFLSPQQWNLE